MGGPFLKDFIKHNHLINISEDHINIAVIAAIMRAISMLDFNFKSNSILHKTNDLDLVKPHFWIW